MHTGGLPANLLPAYPLAPGVGSEGISATPQLASVTNQPPEWVWPPPIAAADPRFADVGVTITLPPDTVAGTLVTELYAVDPDPLYFASGERPTRQASTTRQLSSRYRALSTPLPLVRHRILFAGQVRYTLTWDTGNLAFATLDINGKPISFPGRLEYIEKGPAYPTNNHSAATQVRGVRNWLQ